MAASTSLQASAAGASTLTVSPEQAKPAAPATPIPAPAQSPAQPEAVSLASTSPTFEAEEQLRRIYGILQRSRQRRSPDMELKRTILEADLLSLADKWDQLIL